MDLHEKKRKDKVKLLRQVKIYFYNNFQGKEKYNWGGQGTRIEKIVKKLIFFSIKVIARCSNIKVKKDHRSVQK